MRIRRRRLILTVALLLVVAGGAAVALGSSVWLDPGDKGDTSTDLVTPTLSASGARVFDVAPDESRVDFVVRVYGLELVGVFPVDEGTITLEPAGDQLRVLVRLQIDVDHVATGNAQVDDLLRGVMETGDYPLAFYVATSRDRVPVTGDVITFDLVGDLDVHHVVAPHAMRVEAQLVGREIWAVATSDLDLAAHGVQLPAFASGSTTIRLTARLQAYEVEPPLSDD